MAERDQGKICTYDNILDLSQRNCSEFPGSKCCNNSQSDHMANFDTCLEEFWADDSLSHDDIIDRPMYGNASHPLAFSFSLTSNHNKSDEYLVTNQFYTEIEEYFSEKFKGMETSAWYYVDLRFFPIQISIANGAYEALGLAVIVASIVLLVCTLNVAIFLASAATIAAIIFTTISALVLMEWELNILESMTITLAVGLSMDFVLHLAVAFKLCETDLDSDGKIQQVLSSVSTAVTMAALTTFLAGISLIRVQTKFLLQLGTFLMLIMTISWVYSIFFFLPLVVLLSQGVDGLKLYYQDRKKVDIRADFAPS